VQPTYYPGVAFSHSPYVLDQFFRVQYPEFNTPENETLEAKALAVLVDDIKKEGRGKSIVFSHSSGGVRGFRSGLYTNNLAAHVSFEPANAFFPIGEEPMIKLLDGTLVPAANSPPVPLEEFKKLTKFPHLIIWGDNLPYEVDPASTTAPAISIRAERFKLMAAAINKYGGHAVNLFLPQVGVFGNTHYVMADTNVNKVADQIKKWLKKERLDRGGHNDDDDDHHH
jgi:hypothetical protein